MKTQYLFLITLLVWLFVQGCAFALPETGTSEASQSQIDRVAQASPKNLTRPQNGTNSGRPDSASALFVQQVGFGQVDNQVGYAFSVLNANQLEAVSQVEYQVVAYDQNGVDLGQDQGTIAVIKYHQFAMVAGVLSVQPNSAVDRIEVTLGKGQPLFTKQSPTFAPTEMAPTGLNPLALETATSVVTNVYEVTVTDVRVSAVVYDEDGGIIGGGHSLVESIPAKSSVDVAIPIIFDQTSSVGRIQIFPAPTDPAPVGSVRPAEPVPLVKLENFNESEPNNSQATANFIELGFDEGEDSAFTISGTAETITPTLITPNPEDDGDINKATDTGLTTGQAIVASAEIGDGPFGGTSGDADFYRVDAEAGQLIFVATKAQSPGSLDTVVDIYDSTGELLVFDDDGGIGTDSLLSFTAPLTDSYYVGVYGFPVFLTDRFDSSSGDGAGSTGPYEVAISLDAQDRDFFSFELEAGDILGANLAIGSNALLSLRAPNGQELIGSADNFSSIYPAASLLPGGGAVGSAYVIDTPGTYALSIVPSGPYALQVQLFRPPLRSQPVGAQQILFLDFDGATVNPNIFGGLPGSSNLSPLSAFLPRWGLNAAAEDAVIDAIIASVEENFNDVRLGNNGDRDASGINGEYDIEILNSRDHPDPFGQPNVSRVIIGGTITELGINTIGIAESIDPGNFETEESAVVLLDLLSEGASNPNSLNQYNLIGGATIIDLIGIAVGNITAHEAGHFFGSFHTDQFNAFPNIMDQGGNLDNSIGIGSDATFGSGDDVDVDFGKDIYVPNEGLTGQEDTLNLIAFGLSTGRIGPEIMVQPTILTVTQNVDEIITRTLAISNVGTADLTWTITEAANDVGCTTPVDTTWVTVVPTASTTISNTNQLVSLIFNSAGLTEGTLTSTLCIDSNDSENPRVTAGLMLSVDELERIFLPVILK